jgi:HD-GYP domain-containing protein (c-di-GMP phosphodiesterase class II)
MGDFKIIGIDDLLGQVDFHTHTPHSLPRIIILKAPLSEAEIKKLPPTGDVIILATGSAWGERRPAYVSAFVDDPSDHQQILWALETAKKLIELRFENQHLQAKVTIEADRMRSVIQCTQQVAEEKDPHKLCDRILEILRAQVKAEAASLYILTSDQKHLRFLHVQNERVQVEHKEFILPINENSMAGACAFHRKIIHVPDVRNIPETEKFKFNDSFDRDTGYRTQSALSIPLIKSNGELVGVVQLLNSKRDITFTQDDIEMGQVLSTSIASSLETSLLYQEIENSLEGFVKAAVVAIESRDPVTSGHSERVADYTCSLAQAVSDSTHKDFKTIRFNETTLKEIRYASLLHDFGKIGVPESILQKEKKLYAAEMEMISLRARLIKLAHPEHSDLMDRFVRALLQANEPTVQSSEICAELAEFARQSFVLFGQSQPLLTPQEFKRLSIPKGSLSEEERRMIESHVEHTFNFLSRIPWSSKMKRVPEIARSHHEKMDGTGYPRGLKAAEIPIESQIMAVADIYDALTAPDRPYKKSVPPDRAFLILRDYAEQDKINKELVQLCIEQKAFVHRR